jgi:YfiH family protein
MSMPMDKIISGSSPDVGQSAASDAETLTENGFYWRESGGVKVLIDRRLEDAGFVNGFSTRLGGVSPFPKDSLNLAGFDEDSADNIHENRRRFLNVLEGKFELATVWQVHGDNVKVLRDASDVDDSIERADAMVSDVHGVLLGVKTADCVPILLGDTRTGAFAAVHAGWRGTSQSIVTKAIERMREVFGTSPRDIIAAIGPSASCQSYEVGSDVVETFHQNFGDVDRYFTPTKEGHALVDLPSVNCDQLIGMGVETDSIDITSLCTMTRTDLFFSYRIEKKKYGKTGRLMSVIGRL